MKTIKVSQQKALGIIRREQGKWRWKDVWTWLMQGEAILLNSGAKIWYRSKKSCIQEQGFYIGGYSYDGSDVDVYA